MSAVVIGVGTNLGAREAAIHGARELLGARPGIEVVAMSPIYETEPLGPAQPDYLNAAFRLETSLSPLELLHVVMRTERRLGRKRSDRERWGPRSVDLDLLWDSRGPHESERLTVPHRELMRRDFALAPALDVAPELGARAVRALEDLGGPPRRWGHEALVRTAGDRERLEVEVEAETLFDACAAFASLGDGRRRPWSTLHVVLEPSAEAFGRALQSSLRTGFEVRRATLSNCSKSQWVAQFHGVNLGTHTEAHVRLQTASGVARQAHLEGSIERPAI